MTQGQRTSPPIWCWLWPDLSPVEVDRLSEYRIPLSIAAEALGVTRQAIFSAVKRGVFHAVQFPETPGSERGQYLTTLSTLERYAPILRGRSSKPSVFETGTIDYSAIPPLLGIRFFGGEPVRITPDLDPEDDFALDPELLADTPLASR